MVTENMRLRWRHPYHGYIEETACETHEREVIQALRVLGMGSTSQYEWEETRTCLRCAHSGQRVYTWIETARRVYV